MKKTIKKIDDTKLKLSVTIEKAELAEAQKTAAKELSKDVEVKGFRKGKVPADIAEKQVNPVELMNQAAEIAVNNALIAVMTEENIRPVDRPNVELGEFSPEKLEFTAEITVLPAFKLPDYKKLTSKQVNPEIKASDVNNVIENLRKQSAEKHEKTEAAVLGDEAVIDFIGRFAKDDVEFPGGTGKDFPLQLGSGQFIPGFEEAIVGHKAGEEFDIPLSFPKDYHAENLAGQKVIFKTKLNKIHELKLPEITEEFVKSLGAPNVTNEKELKADIKRELAARAEQQTIEKFKNDLIDELVEKTKVQIPEILINDQIQALKQEATQNLMQRQITLPKYLEEKKFKDEKEWETKELAPIAEKRAKAGLILAELAQAEKVTVTDDEIDNRIKAIQMQFNDPQLKNMYENNPAAKQNVANQIVTEKTLNRLFELNK